MDSVIHLLNVWDVIVVVNVVGIFLVRGKSVWGLVVNIFVLLWNIWEKLFVGF